MTPTTSPHPDTAQAPPRPVVYEVTLTARLAIASAFDAWLTEHVAEMVRLPGFLDADVALAEPPDQGSIVRIARYRLANRDALDHYFNQYADTMRAKGVQRFGGQITATRRILESSAGAPVSGAEHRYCDNCQERLTGRFCAACGQNSASRVLSMWGLLHDFFGSYVNFDSRLVQSVVPLLSRPGFLTNEYLSGRRARYITPFKLYISISIVFFFLLSVVSFNDSNEPTVGNAPTKQQLAKMKKEMADATPFERTLQRHAIRIARNPRAYFADVIDKVPTLMFLLLPFFALVLKLLYIRRKRYYVEHLIFSVHYHSLVFLAAIICMAAYMASVAAGVVAVGDFLVFALWLYLTGYLLVAMRRVYRQGRIKTFVKWLFLASVYGFALTGAAVAAITWAALGAWRT